MEQKILVLLKRGLVALLACSLIITPIPVTATKKKQLIERIEFHDISMADALRLLSDQYGINVITSKKAAEVGVTMFLNQVSPTDVLETLAKTYNLWYRRDPGSNIYRMYTAEEFRLGNVTAEREHVKVFTARYQNVLSIAYAIKNLFPERVQMTLGNEQNQIYQDLRNRFRRFDLIASKSSISNRSGGSSGSSGSGSGNSSSGSGGRSGQSFSRGKGLNNTLSLLSNKTLQNNLQTVIAGEVKSQDSEIRQFVQEDAPVFLTVLKNQNNILVRTRDPTVIKEVEKLVAKLDKPPIAVLLEVKILSISLSDGFNSVFDFSLADKNSSLSGSREPVINTNTSHSIDVNNGVTTTSSSISSSGNLSSNTVNSTRVVGTGIAGMLGATQLSGAALMAKLVSNQFELRLQMLEKEGRVTELATPMVSTANQEVSRINLITEVPIVRGYKVVTAGGGGVSGGSAVSRLEPQTTVEQVGTTLIMTPSVSTDHSINMNLLIDRSAVSVSQSTIRVEDGNGNITPVPIDTIDRRSFAGNIIMKDNIPVAIGGLITERASDIENKVPVLGDIPGLGFFFNDQGRKRSREELVIVITPHIMENLQGSKAYTKTFLQQNSLHPSAKTLQSLNVYSNQDKEHKRYQLDQAYQLNRYQDKLDQHRWNQTDQAELSKKDRQAAVHSHPRISAAARKVYMRLTRYAAKSVRLLPKPGAKVRGISATPLKSRHHVNLFANPALRVRPLASWRQGGIYVTALAMFNHSSDQVTIDQRDIQGQWLAATLETKALTAEGELGDSGYLYLISAQPFDEVVGND